MAERLPNSAERDDKAQEQSAAELEQLTKQPEVSAEQVAADRERAEQSEKKAAEKLSELQTEKKAEREPVKAERQEEIAKSPEKSGSKSERRQALKEELTSVRQHLTPAQRALSQVVHNPIIERASEALEETVFRPSIVVGGAIGAIIVGGVLYGFAKVRGYLLPGSEFMVGLIIGAVLGILVELLHWLVRGRKAS